MTTKTHGLLFLNNKSVVSSTLKFGQTSNVSFRPLVKSKSLLTSKSNKALEIEIEIKRKMKTVVAVVTEEMSVKYFLRFVECSFNVG